MSKKNKFQKKESKIESKKNIFGETKYKLENKKGTIEEITGLISNGSTYVGFTNFIDFNEDHVINLPEWLIDLIESGRFSDLVINGRDPGVTSFITSDRENTINLPDWFVELVKK